MKLEFGCNTCVSDFNNSGPGLRVAENKELTTSSSINDETRRKLLENGPAECVISSHSMLLNCDNSEESL